MVRLVQAQQPALVGPDLSTVEDAGSIAVSCNVNSQSHASGRSEVSRELSSSSEVNLVEVSSMLRIRLHPEV